MISLQKGLGIGLFILAGEVFCSNLCRCNLYSTSTYYYIAVAGFQRQSLLPDSSSSSVCSFGRSSSGSGTCMCLWCRIFVYSIKKSRAAPTFQYYYCRQKVRAKSSVGNSPVRPTTKSSRSGLLCTVARAAAVVVGVVLLLPPPPLLTAQAADSMKKRALVVSRLLCCT